MADDIGGLVTGPGDPFGAQELNILGQMQQAQQVAAQTGPGHELSGFLASSLRSDAANQLAQITPLKLDAQNDYAAALNYRDPQTGLLDPVGYAAATPDMNQYARYRLLTASPSQVAVDRYNLARGMQAGIEAQRGAAMLPAYKEAAAEVGQAGGAAGPLGRPLGYGGPLVSGEGGTTAAPTMSYDAFASLSPTQRQAAVTAYKARKAQGRSQAPGGGAAPGGPMFPGATR
jgi:hypothetical protein